MSDEKRDGGEVVQLSLVRGAPADGKGGEATGLNAADRDRIRPTMELIRDKVEAGEVAILVAATVRQDGTCMIYIAQPGDQGSEMVTIGACSSLLHAAHTIIAGDYKIRE